MQARNKRIIGSFLQEPQDNFKVTVVSRRTLCCAGAVQQTAEGEVVGLSTTWCAGCFALLSVRTAAAAVIAPRC